MLQRTTMNRQMVSNVIGVGILIAFVGLFLWITYQSAETPGERRERLQNAPEVACEAMLRDSRRIDGVEEYREIDEHYTQGDLRYEKDLDEYAMDQLDGATDPEAQAILRYLQHSENAQDALAQTGDMGVVEDMIPVSQGLREDTVEACTDLGHPEWEEYLQERDGSE